MRIAIINGLNLLGTREPDIYGTQPFEAYLQTLRERFTNVEISYYQSNVEGELINHMHACMSNTAGIVLNAGAYTHTSIALADAVAAVGKPVIEVHISNVLAREDYRKTSFIAAKCKGSISGLGLEVNTVITRVSDVQKIYTAPYVRDMTGKKPSFVWLKVGNLDY